MQNKRDSSALHCEGREVLRIVNRGGDELASLENCLFETLFVLKSLSKGCLSNLKSYTTQQAREICALLGLPTSVGGL